MDLYAALKLTDVLSHNLPIMIRRLSSVSLTTKKQKLQKQQKRKTVTFLPPPTSRQSITHKPDLDAFMRAAISNDVLAMRNMTHAGLNSNGCLGDDPILILCARMGYLSAVKVILQAGPCDDIIDANGLTALHHAAMHGHTQIVQLLLQAGAYVDTRVHSEGECYYMTPLILVCMHNRAATAAALLDRKASVHATDHLGRTALHHACSRSDTHVLVYQLLAAGADAELPDTSETTPLMYAAMALNLRVVKALLVWGVDIDARGGREEDGSRDAVYWTKRDKRGSIVTLVDSRCGNVAFDGTGVAR